MKIQDVRSLVEQEIQKEGVDHKGQLMGDLNGRKVSIGSPKNEQAFAQMVLHHARNIELNDHDVEALINRVSDVKLIQGKGVDQGKVIFQEFQLPSVRLGIARVLLEAASRPENASRRSLSDLIFMQWGNQVEVLEARPSKDVADAVTLPLIWESQSQPGQYGVHLPGAKPFKMAKNLDEITVLLTQYGIHPRISYGEGITVDGTDFPVTERMAMAESLGINIDPVVIQGKEIAYRFSAKSGFNPQVLVSSHGSARSDGLTFKKQKQLTFLFASPTNHILASNTLQFSEHFMRGKVAFQDSSQVYDGSVEEATNYKLRGNIRTQPNQIAEFIQRMQNTKSPELFDFVLLNREASGIRFSDLIQAMQDTFGMDAQKKLICHFCRPKNEDAARFYVKENFI